MSTMKKQIEVEFRSRFSEEKYNELYKFLLTSAQDLGVDDKDVHFFLLEDKLLKVTHNTAQETAKVTLKLNNIGNGSAFEELEYPINPNDVDCAVSIFKQLGFNNLIHADQKRHNFLYKGVEIALKYSENWTHHMELEVLIDDLTKKNEAEQKIYSIAEELGVHIMTEEELNLFLEQFKKN
jgi:predicted adenylyl cyclase CyaB